MNYFFVVLMRQQLNIDQSNVLEFSTNDDADDGDAENFNDVAVDLAIPDSSETADDDAGPDGDVGDAENFDDANASCDEPPTACRLDAFAVDGDIVKEVEKTKCLNKMQEIFHGKGSKVSFGKKDHQEPLIPSQVPSCCTASSQ